LLILGPDGSLVRANGAVAELLGMDRGLGDDSAPAALADAIDQVVDRRAVILGDYCAQARNRDGLRIDLEVRPSAPLEASDRILVLRNMSQDREAAEHRSFFISQISHELRTPLQHILSSVSLIGDIPDLGPDDRQRYLRHIEDETYHLGKLVDDLVALSRIEAGHFEVYPEPVKVDELLGSVADRLEPRAETRHLTIVMHCTERPVWAYTDPLRLEQVLLNVLSNACKYTPARSCIRVTVLADEDQVEVLVADQGPGIPPEEMQLIFDPYYRLSRNVHEPGMGLGLFISQQIMTMLGGQISVRSPSGAGSVFAIRFPRGLHLLRNR